MEVLNYKPVAKGCIVASFDLKTSLNGKSFIIRGLLEMEKGESHWISFPSHKFEMDGKQCYKYHCLFEDEKDNRDFLNDVSVALKDGAGKSMIQEQMPF
jgi:hypothetical protein